MCRSFHALLPSIFVVLLPVSSLGTTEPIFHAEWRQNTAVVLAGPEEWLDQPRVPASTFKVVHALAAVRKGLAVREARWWSDETRVQGAPGRVDAQTGMRASSNQIFVQMASEVGAPSLEHAIESWWPGVALPNGWPVGGLEASVHGAGLHVSPRQQLEAWARLRDARLGLTAEQQRNLEWILEHHRHENRRLLAKSGTYGGTLWLIGFVFEPDNSRGPILLMTSRYPIPHWQEGRTRLIERFNAKLPEGSGLTFR